MFGVLPVDSLKGKKNNKINTIKTAVLCSFPFQAVGILQTEGRPGEGGMAAPRMLSGLQTFSSLTQNQCYRSPLPSHLPACQNLLKSFQKCQFLDLPAGDFDSPDQRDRYPEVKFLKSPAGDSQRCLARFYNPNGVAQDQIPTSQRKLDNTSTPGHAASA